MTEPGSWMASLDLKDAFSQYPFTLIIESFLSLHIKESHRLDSMSNEHPDAMRIFTKVLEPGFSHLREIGFLSVKYVGASYLQGETFEECLQNITETVKLLQSVGFTINPEKSVLKPTQQLIFLRFFLNSKTMTLTLTNTKKKIKVSN